MKWFKKKKVEIVEETKEESTDISVLHIDCQSCDKGMYKKINESHKGLGPVYICDKCGERNYEYNLRSKQ